MRRRRFWYFSSGLLAILIFLVGSLKIYHWVFHKNNTTFETDVYNFTVKDSCTYHDLCQNLTEAGILKRPSSFRYAADYLRLDTSFKSGLFQIKRKSSNSDLVDLFSTNPPPHIKIPIKKIRFRRAMARSITSKLDIKSRTIYQAFTDPDILAYMGPEFNTENAYCLFFEDTLTLYKNINKKELAKALYRNYDDFWTPEKKFRAEIIGLTPIETMIMASIITAETNNPDEMARIAGVYMNRYYDDRKLQADPTVCYAIGQKPIRRVLNRHVRVRSPYNTYRVKGLPPGPVHVISPKAVEAVLNYEEHPFYFFCAKPDFSGQHDFCETYQEHLELAKSYHRVLTKKNIK